MDVQESDAGIYHCVATNAARKRYSNDATLSVVKGELLPGTGLPGSHCVRGELGSDTSNHLPSWCGSVHGQLWLTLAEKAFHERFVFAVMG